MNELALNEEMALHFARSHEWCRGSPGVGLSPRMSSMEKGVVRSFGIAGGGGEDSFCNKNIAFILALFTCNDSGHVRITVALWGPEGHATKGLRSSSPNVKPCHSSHFCRTSNSLNMATMLDS
ncbi:hypothetical protein JTE90_014986 [Oedothorax gibbosus]|uniref:Uncharacterized protein n=1 Tax=Oedothorax gibbosus TaxID=931172 RepID=A0AAV6UZ46_9ARAC|nr:hypothetical protein JTE90_014986 [Oedothorax gibbosus]